MSKLNVGDKVLILPRTRPKEDYRHGYIDEMLPFSNNIATVTTVYSDCCNLDICDIHYNWDFDILLKLDKPVNYNKLSEGEIIVLKIGDEYIKGEVRVSSIGRYYINPKCEIDRLNELCSMTVEELTKKFSGRSRKVLIAKDKEKLKEMLDFINDLAMVDTVKFNDKPINQEHYVIKLQRTKALVRRAEVPKGSRVCSKINKAAISIQPLSHTVCLR